MSVLKHQSAPKQIEAAYGLLKANKAQIYEINLLNAVKELQIPKGESFELLVELGKFDEERAEFYYLPQNNSALKKLEHKIVEHENKKMLSLKIDHLGYFALVEKAKKQENEHTNPQQTPKNNNPDTKSNEREDSSNSSNSDLSNSGSSGKVQRITPSIPSKPEKKPETKPETKPQADHQLQVLPELTITVRPQTVEKVEKFEDVKPDSWYVNALTYAVERELMNGISEKAFEPNANATRAQLVTILYRFAGKPQTAGTQNFTDVSNQAYYKEAVLWATQNNIVKGVS